MAESDDDVSVAALQHLILTSGTLEPFLEGFAEHASTVLEGTIEVLCGVTLKREHHAATVASSSVEAIALDEVQYGNGEGPSLHAIRTGTTTVVTDARTDMRWPKYFAAVREQGYHSMLSTPLLRGEDGGVSVNLYAREPGAFTPPIIQRVEIYAAEISLTLNLALRLAAHERASTHLKAAMESRTNIDIAVGIVVAQNRCTPDEAIGILQRASNGQNIKLRALAEQLVTSIGTTPARTHFAD